MKSAARDIGYAPLQSASTPRFWGRIETGGFRYLVSVSNKPRATWSSLDPAADNPRDHGDRVGRRVFARPDDMAVGADQDQARRIGFTPVGQTVAHDLQRHAERLGGGVECRHG